MYFVIINISIKSMEPIRRKLIIINSLDSCFILAFFSLVSFNIMHGYLSSCKTNKCPINICMNALQKPLANNTSIFNKLYSRIVLYKIKSYYVPTCVNYYSYLSAFMHLWFYYGRVSLMCCMYVMGIGMVYVYCAISAM